MRYQFTQNTPIGDVMISRGSVVDATVSADGRTLSFKLNDGREVFLDLKLYGKQVVKVDDSLAANLVQSSIAMMNDWKDFFADKFNLVYDPIKSPLQIGAIAGIAVGLAYANHHHKQLGGIFSSVLVFTGIGLVAGLIISEKNTYDLGKTLGTAKLIEDQIIETPSTAIN